MIIEQCKERGVLYKNICECCKSRNTEIVYILSHLGKARGQLLSYCRFCAEHLALGLFNDIQRVVLELDDEMAYNFYLNFIDKWNERLGRDVLNFDNKYQDDSDA